MEFTYERQLVEQSGEGMIISLTRAEVKDRLIDWVIDTEISLQLLESYPSEWHRLTPFAYYRAVPTTEKGGTNE